MTIFVAILVSLLIITGSSLLTLALIVGRENDDFGPFTIYSITMSIGLLAFGVVGVFAIALDWK